MGLIGGRGHKLERDMRFGSMFKVFGLFNFLKSIASTAYC